MKGKKYRYDEKKLSRNTSLKKRMALHLAIEFVAKNRDSIAVAEIFAYGLTQRPFASFSDKELIKQFDASYAEKFDKLDEKKKIHADYVSERNYRADYIRSDMAEIQKQIDAMQPMIDELLEEAFSE